jgi:multicomponent Na+:H+ antiporter subunit A
MRRRVVSLERSAHLIFHAVLVGSLYLLFAGHNQPGGGFVGGLVAGAAITLRYLSGGLDEVRRLSPVKPWTIMAGGVVLSVSTALAPLLAGRPILTALGVTIDPAVLGHVYLSTTLAFDVGVYMVVVGLVFMVFEAFGDDTDPIDGVEEGGPA